MFSYIALSSFFEDAGHIEEGLPLNSLSPSVLCFSQDDFVFFCAFVNEVTLHVLPPALV